jgi:SagB-type dehydrogenase family enzyme
MWKGECGKAKVTRELNSFPTPQSAFHNQEGCMKKQILAIGIFCLVAVVMAYAAFAVDIADITLPAPKMEGGKPLMEVLKNRQSSREFDSKKVPPQVLSDLLWAAAGINRPDSGKRTAPSARDWQEVDVFVVMEEGAYRYDGKAGVLKAVTKGDIRKLAGSQDFVAKAPINLVYVADTAKMKGSAPEDRAMYTGADTGFMGQNVYLFCASEGLATVIRASVDRKALAEALALTETQKITLVQTVGYPN